MELSGLTDQTAVDRGKVYQISGKSVKPDALSVAAKYNNIGTVGRALCTS